MKKFGLLIFLSGISHLLPAQHASIATDVSLLRSFTKGSVFWAIGQTVQAHYHFAPQTSGYASICYFTSGRFQHELSARANDSSANPQQVAYIAKTALRFRQFSLGMRHYFKGAYNSESAWNLYGLAGFGLLLVQATNTRSVAIDTARYAVAQQAVAGTKTVVRLTADVGLGVETLIGGGIYLYGDLRTWIQASRFPSPYLYNNALPRVVVLSGGLRILFD